MSTSLHLTTTEYDRMVACGAFGGLGRTVELIRGEIREMSPAGPVHDELVEYLRKWSFRVSDPDRFDIRGQTGMDLPELDSRLEPDVFWVTVGRYFDGHPTAKDTHLAIEVADSSLKSDRTIKAELYAEAGIAEYWVVDATHRCIHLYREPGLYREPRPDARYHWQRTAKLGEQIQPLAQPGATLNLSDLFATDHA